MKKTKKCSCGYRFRLHDWMTEEEKEKCFLCKQADSTLKAVEESLNMLHAEKGYKRKIKISYEWIF